MLDPYVVTATRGQQTLSETPTSVRVFEADEIERTPALTLDGALRSVPGFSLFRRSDSLSAHPTTQGVSLRGLGPSGASRTLVLLDGVPVNDPFGGWVAWSKLPRLSLNRVELVRGAGATAWGNSALGGVIQLLSREPDPSNSILQLQAGSDSLVSAGFVAAKRFGSGVLEISGNFFRTDGFKVVAPEDAGPVDIAAWQRHQWLSAKWVQQVAQDTTVTFTGREFSEKRGNGTALQGNRSRDDLGSIKVEHHPKAGLSWTAVVFAEDEEFSSTFSAVSADRTSETPASDQFSVPASSWGLSWTASFDSGNASSTSIGADFRSVRGETNEDSNFSNGSFIRRRVAGGEQQIGGLFAFHTISLTDSLRLVGGLRADHWGDSNGFRRESLIATGELTRDDTYADRHGWELSPSAGVVWKAEPGLSFRATAQRAFRRPTLNELYRPFRVGSIITEANPELGTETVDTIETGVEFTNGPIKINGTLFHHQMNNAVANVTLFHGPGNFPGIGFVPDGGLGRKRLNLDRIVVQGVELGVRASLSKSLTISAEYLLSDARVRDGAPDSSLDGKRLAQVPRDSATLSMEWRGPHGLQVSPRVRIFSRQFEDDENLLPLAGATVADLRVAFPVGSSASLFILCENIGDTRVETGKSAAGVTSIGTPRTVSAGFQLIF